MKRLDFKLKPIPKYIVKRIQKLNKERCPEQKGPIRFYSYLSKIKGELVKVTVATITRYKRWCCKQVAVHGVKSDKCFVRDMEYTPLGGYRIGFYAEGMVKHKPWYEDGFWYDADFKYYNPFSTTVNMEYVGRFSQYKFSAYQHLTGDCIIKYLRIYLKYPQTEYLLKLGLSKLHDKLTILKIIAKDKKFCKWLIAHGNEIATSYCYAGVLIKAYRTSRPITQTQKIEEFKKRLRNDTSLQVIKKMFGDKLEQFFAYITNQNTDPNSYLDYLNACKYLKLDMNLPKNYFPHDFKRWHDIRIDQYHTAKAKADEKERKKLYKQFATVAKKYLSLQNCKKGAYAVFIARSPFELLVRVSN